MGEKYQKIFRQSPLRGFSVNTESRIDPIHIDFNLVPDSVELALNKAVPRRFGLDFDCDWFHLYFMTSALPVELGSVPLIEEEGRQTALCCLDKSAVQRIVGEGSTYSQYMAGASKKIARYFDAGITMPYTIYGSLCRSAMEQMAIRAVDVESTRIQLGNRGTQDRLVQQLQQLSTNLLQVDAILRVLRRAALDLCALIGAVELPSWPAYPRLSGVILYPSQANKLTSRETDEVGLLERWGVPVWLVERSGDKSRYELNATARPQLGRYNDEAVHQEKLMQAVSMGIRVEEVYVLDEMMPVAPPVSKLDSDDFEKQLDSLLLAALAPESSQELVCFDEFSIKVAEILGKDRWTGQQHEAGLHGQLEGRKWHVSRPYPFLIRNAPALFSRRTVPPHYFNPTLLFPNKRGGLPAPPPNPPTTPNKLWHCLELRHFDSIHEIGDVSQFHPSIFAYRISRTSQSARDGGFAKGLKPYVLQLWGKERSELQAAARRLPNSLRKKECAELESTDPLAPSHWTPFVNLEYISKVLAVSRSSEVRAGLLRLIPTMPAPCADDLNYRQLKVRYLHFLRHELPGGPRFRPSVCRAASKTPPLPMWRFEFTKEFLQNLTLKPRPPSLTVLAFIELHRLEIILDMLSSAGVAFRMQLIPNDGPCAQIFSLISTEVAESKPSDQCKVWPAAPNAEPRMEGVVWDEKAKRFSLFLLYPARDLRPLNRSQIQAWRDAEENTLRAELAKKKHQPRSAPALGSA